MQRKPNKHRLLPAALSLAMVLTMVPAHAAAAGQQPPVPETTVNSDQFSHAFKLDFGYQNSSWMERITALSVDGVPYEQVSSTIYLKTGTYVVQPSDGRIVLPPSLSGKVTCVIRAEGYEELNLSLDTGAYTVAVNPPAPAGTLPAAELPGGMSASLEQAMSVYLKLTHGTGDDNVHFQNTLQLVNALQRAGRSFELMVYPDGKHGYGGYQGEHFRAENRRFWTRYLLQGR